MSTYPTIEIHLNKIRENARIACSYCGEKGIDVAGVVKFSDGNLKIARAYYEGGCKQIASSRSIQLKAIKEAYPEIETMLIRIPMISEVDDVVEFCDISLNSERTVLEALNSAAQNHNTIHNVILMYDLCDRREGIIDRTEFVELADHVENNLRFLHLKGIGTTFACLSGTTPSYELLEQLVDVAQAIEVKIGRKLEIISGGSSISLQLLKKVGFPKEINHLRLGGFIANPVNMHKNYDTYIGDETEDCFRLDVEIVEVKEKDLPEVTGYNWAGHPIHVDAQPPHIRAIIAVGCQDIGGCGELIPIAPGVKVIAASSDHTVLDVSEASMKYKPGDVVHFKLYYEGLLYAFTSRHVAKKYE